MRHDILNKAPTITKQCTTTLYVYFQPKPRKSAINDDIECGHLEQQVNTLANVLLFLLL